MNQQCLIIGARVAAGEPRICQTTRQNCITLGHVRLERSASLSGGRASCSTIRAAKVLGINQSTVQRRLAAFERELGRPLFQRSPEGYRLTRLGQELCPIAERVEVDVADLARHVASSETELVGTIRVTCPETAGYRIMKSSLLDVFHKRYPGLQVELVMVDRILDLAKGEAEVAFRTSAPQDEARGGCGETDHAFRVAP